MEYKDNGKYVKCPRDPKCIGSWKVCNGKQDCPSGGDEDDCSKEACSRMGKFKCPNENKCIEERFVCSFTGYSKYMRNKCEYIDACIELCHQESNEKYICPRTSSIPGKLFGKSEYCLFYNETCCFI